MTAQHGFLLRHLGAPLLLAALLLALDTTALDTAVTGWFFDSDSHAFPLRYNTALEVMGHHGARLAAIVVAGIVIFMFLLSFILREFRPHRRLLLFLSLALTLAPLAVVLLKEVSMRYCPWDLVEYGGFAQFLPPFRAEQTGVPPGRCFPGGHASAGFSLFAFYFAGLALGNRRLARIGLGSGLVAGMTFGTVRIAQGAHFLSHNLWSALVCWLVILVLYIAIIGARGDLPTTIPATDDTG